MPYIFLFFFFVTTQVYGVPKKKKPSKQNKKCKFSGAKMNISYYAKLKAINSYYHTLVKGRLAGILGENILKY